MTELSRKWEPVWKNLQLVVGVVLGVTLSTLSNLLGLVVLAFIWMGLAVVVASIYAVRLRVDVARAKKSASSKVEELEEELADIQAIVEKLMIEKSELQRQLRSASGEEETATRAEENVMLKSEVEYLRAREKKTEKLKVQLRQQLAETGQLRKVGIYGGGKGRKSFKVWHRRTEVILGQAFGEDSSQLQSFLRIRFKGSPLENRPSVYQEALDEAEAILKVAIEEELSNNE